MPITASLGALNYVRLSSESNYWLLITNTTTYPFKSIAVDSNNLIYAGGGNYIFQFQDNITHPSKNWSKTIDTTGSSESIEDLKYSSYYNKVGFILTDTYTSPTYPNPTMRETIVGMINNDGSVGSANIARNRVNDYAASAYKYASTFTVNNSGQIYHLGYKGGNATTLSNIMCDLLTNYTSAGTYLYEAGCNVTNCTLANGTGGQINSTNNIIYLGYIQGATSATREVVLTKANTAPTFPPGQLVPIWQRKLTLNQYLTTSRMILDGSDNSYSIVNETNAKDSYLVKYNDSGTIQWQRKLTGVQLNSLILSDDGYIYTVGTTSTNNLFIAKYSTAGVIQYQNKISGTSFNTPCIEVVNDNMYIVGSISYGFLIKLPKDGTIPGTGSYPIGGSTVLTYSIATQTEGAGTLTDASEYLYPPSAPGVVSSGTNNNTTLTQNNNIFSL